MIEFGLMRRLTDIVTVTDARMERILCRARWPLKRLGAPRAIGKTIAVAGYLEVSRERLRSVREAGGLSAPAICDGESESDGSIRAKRRRRRSRKSSIGSRWKPGAGERRHGKRLYSFGPSTRRSPHPGCRFQHRRRRVDLAKPVGHGDP
jgi:hypothetical protein